MAENTNKSVAKVQDVSIMEEVIIKGNLADLSGEQRAEYYLALCHSMGLNHFTKPFEYIELDKKLVLYATRNATDQLRNINKINIRIVSESTVGNMRMVVVEATNESGRVDTDIAVVPLEKEEVIWTDNPPPQKNYPKKTGKIIPLVGADLANAYMKALCVPLDSEILTRSGWKTYDQLTIDEDVLAYDLESDTSTWTPLLEVKTYTDAPVSRLASAGGQFDMRCTPDHSWAVKKLPLYRPDHRTDGSRGPRGAYATRTPDRLLVKANALTGNHRIILAAPETATDESLLSPAEAAILGWAVTDGTIKRVGNNVRIGICQSKERNFAPIRELIGAVAEGAKELVSPGVVRTFPTGKTYDTKEQHWWYIPSAISKAILEHAGFHDRSDLPSIATRLDSAARKAMLQAFMLAEGDERGGFHNGDQSILDTFEILCALEGIATGKPAKNQTIKRQRLKKTCHVAANFLTLTEDGVADVWCPTTAFGTWVMRQNGRVTITGNTKAKRRVTLSICGLSFLDESELETVNRKKSPKVTVADDMHALEADNGNPASRDDVEQVDGELVEDEPSMDPPSKSEADDWRDQIKTMYAMTDEKAKRAAIGPIVAQAQKEWWRFNALIVFATNKDLAERMHEKAQAAGADVVKLDEWMGDFEMAQAMAAPA